MNVLVTGGAGFIGSHLVERLADRGAQVTVLDDLRGPDSRAPARPGVTFRNGDIRDEAALDAVFAEGPFEVVVHLAALVGVRDSVRWPAAYHAVNVEGTHAVLKRLSGAGSHVVFASSSSVYGVRATGPFREEDPTRPASPYARTKLEGERLCAGHHVATGAPVTCLRLFTVYGPGQRRDMAIRRFIEAALAGEALTAYGDGSSRRDYTFVGDVVDGVVAAMAHPSRFRICNLGTGRETTLAELMRAVSEAVGYAPRIEWEAAQSADVPLTQADLTRAARELNYVPRVDLEDGLRRMVASLRPVPASP